MVRLRHWWSLIVWIIPKAHEKAMDCTPISFRYLKARALWSGNIRKDPPFWYRYHTTMSTLSIQRVLWFNVWPGILPFLPRWLSRVDGSPATHRPSPTVPDLLQGIYHIQQRVPASHSTSNEVCLRGQSCQWSSCTTIFGLRSSLSLEQTKRESLNDAKTRAFYETCAI